MPWDAASFAKHNRRLSPAQSGHAARVANAIVRRGAPEGEAIATANAREKRALGGGIGMTLPTEVHEARQTAQLARSTAMKIPHLASGGSGGLVPGQLAFTSPYNPGSPVPVAGAGGLTTVDPTGGAASGLGSYAQTGRKSGPPAAPPASSSSSGGGGSSEPSLGQLGSTAMTAKKLGLFGSGPTSAQVAAGQADLIAPSDTTVGGTGASGAASDTGFVTPPIPPAGGAFTGSPELGANAAALPDSITGGTAATAGSGAAAAGTDAAAAAGVTDAATAAGIDAGATAASTGAVLAGSTAGVDAAATGLAAAGVLGAGADVAGAAAGAGILEALPLLFAARGGRMASGGGINLPSATPEALSLGRGVSTASSAPASSGGNSWDGANGFDNSAVIASNNKAMQAAAAKNTAPPTPSTAPVVADAPWAAEFAGTTPSAAQQAFWDNPPAPQGAGSKRGGSIHMASGGTYMPPQTPWWERQQQQQASRQSLQESGTGFIHSAVPGRTDQINVSPPAGSYVLPADVVSGLGEGNTLAGQHVIQTALSTGPYGTPIPHTGGGHGPPSAPHMDPAGLQQADGGRLAAGGVPVGGPARQPIVAAGGEMILSPEQVARVGRGNIKRGHDVLDAFVLHVRKKTIKDMQGLKGPKK